MRPGQYLTRSLVFVDNRGVDGAVGGLAALVGGLGRPHRGGCRPASSARTRPSMLAGVVLVPVRRPGRADLRVMTT